MEYQEAIDHIIDSCVSVYGISREAFFGPHRRKEGAYARHCAAWLMKKHIKGMSYKAIGDHTNKRDHSTVIHSVQTVDDALFTKDPDFEWLRSFILPPFGNLEVSPLTLVVYADLKEQYSDLFKYIIQSGYEPEVLKCFIEDKFQYLIQ